MTTRLWTCFCTRYITDQNKTRTPKVKTCAQTKRLFSPMSGFTLIELIVVIVILGILAATAMPKFVDMRRQARIAVLKGMEGALRSTVSMSQAAYRIDTTVPKNQSKIGAYIPVPTGSNGTINVLMTVEQDSLGGTTIGGGGIPFASVSTKSAGHKGVVGLLYGMDTCQNETNAFGVWNFYRCQNGWDLLNFSDGGTYPEFGLYFFPSGLLSSNNMPAPFDESVFLAGRGMDPAPACYVKYATPDTDSGTPVNWDRRPFGEDENVVIRAETRDC